MHCADNLAYALIEIEISTFVSLGAKRETFLRRSKVESYSEVSQPFCRSLMILVILGTIIPSLELIWKVFKLNCNLLKTSSER